MRGRNAHDKHVRRLWILTLGLFPLVESIDELLRLVREKEEHARVDGVVMWVGLVGEFCDDAKVAASASDSPEEIGVLGFVCVDDFAVCEDDFDVDEIIDDHSEIRLRKESGVPILAT